MLHRLQLSTQLYRNPDRPEDVAAIIIEQVGGRLVYVWVAKSHERSTCNQKVTGSPLRLGIYFIKEKTV